MTHLLLMLFLAVRPPPPDGCTSNRWGYALELDDRTDGKLPYDYLRITPNGGWEHVVVGKGGTRRSGCMSRPDHARFLRIVDELEHAKWTTTPVATCAAYSPSYREVRVDGKLVYTQRMCDGLALDKTSQRALDDALAFVQSIQGAGGS